MNTTIYDERVPKGVIDIVGDVPCEYILHYNTVHWRNSVFLDGKQNICQTTLKPHI